MKHTSAQEIRLSCRTGEHTGTTRGVAVGYVQCNLVVLSAQYVDDFFLYCERNQKACPVLEVTDPGCPEAKRCAPGSDLRTDLPRYAIYRNGQRIEDATSIIDLWQDDSTAFLIGSGITFDWALQQANIPTDKHRWVLRSNIATEPAGIFHGPMVVTMRWLTPEHARQAAEITARFPLNHGAPIHMGDPTAIGVDMKNPIFGPPVTRVPQNLVPVFWACGVTPQEAGMRSKLDLMITHAPAHGFITDLRAKDLELT
tara:strand:+ start:387 stop:1154 length:768 start_codon:yes stop_codon:yes gene_type:complete